MAWGGSIEQLNQYIVDVPFGKLTSDCFKVKIQGNTKLMYKSSNNDYDNITWNAPSTVIKGSILTVCKCQ